MPSGINMIIRNHLVIFFEQKSAIEKLNAKCPPTPCNHTAHSLCAEAGRGKGASLRKHGGKRSEIWFFSAKI